MADIRVYFAEQTGPDSGKYEIYREGKPTGELLTLTGIRSILTRPQYNEFVRGQEIFKVPGTIFRTRLYKSKVSRRKLNLK